MENNKILKFYNYLPKSDYFYLKFSSDLLKLEEESL